MIYWYEGRCENCKKTIRGRILDDETITVDCYEDEDGWFEGGKCCENPDPIVSEIRDCD